MFKVTCWIFIFYLYLLEHIVEFCFHDFLSIYEGPEVYQFIIRQSSLLFLKFYNQHSWASWGCSSMNGSCKCNEHSPSPIQQSKQEIKSLVLLWPLSHLPSHIVWFRYPLHLLIPPVCPSLSPQINGHIWTSETHKSQLLNAISPLLSGTFHRAASGKEEKNRAGRHRSFPVTIWAEALFPLRAALSSTLPLLSWLLFALSSSQLAMK